ncbi:phosphorylase family protein [Patulibacter defluvii]|uniref:phosphorylase family protein n=1 Tax=Patulibacter defluvii TaxID=3095358 RepID=UPI002A74C53B|nr:hypothetical protein [Patulibacter sp. DM4]
MTRLPEMLHLVNPVAPRAILVGDPGRALELAQALLERPLMSNHQRGLWGYTGRAADGEPLTIQSTGTGGASAVAVVRELAEAGVRRVVRAGSAIAIGPDPAAAGELRTVAFAIPGDGASRTLGGRTPIRPDAALTARLREHAPTAVGVLSVDVLPQDGGETPEAPDDVGALDRQTAALLLAAERFGVVAAAIVAFPHLDGDEERRTAWWRAVGTAAGAALT